MSVKVKSKQQKTASPYKCLRARLIEKEHTFASWAKENGHAYTTVISAAKGERAGIVSVKIKKELEEFANA